MPLQLALRQARDHPARQSDFLGDKRLQHALQCAAALEQIVAEGYSLAYGARFLKRVIESKIKLPISQQWAEGHSFTADVEEGEFVIRVSEARGGYPALAATA